MRVLYVLLASTLSLLVRHQLSLAIPCTLKYTRHEPVSLNININSPSSEVCSYLKHFGIHSTLHRSVCPRKKRFWKYRAGRHIAINRFRTIQVVCNSVCTPSGPISSSMNVANLVNIYPLSVIRNEATHLTMSLFNIQSVCQPEKCVSICDFICDADVDILFLTETWLNVLGVRHSTLILHLVAKKSSHFPG